MRSPFGPLLIVTVAWLAWTAFQTDLLVSERRALGQLHSLQDTQLEEVQKLRASYLTLLTNTQALAEQGDANAKLVLEQLKARGIEPPSQPSGSAHEVPESKAPR